MEGPVAAAGSGCAGFLIADHGVTHTSEPNYIAATSGNNWWVNNDNGWYPLGWH